MRQLPRARAPGFTFIELLAVLFIIVLVIGFLVSAIHKVRATSERTQCGHNLKQLALALQIYADTNRGRLPQVSTYNPPANGMVTYPQAYWFGTLTAPDMVDLSQGFLMPFLEGQRSVEQCPAFDSREFQLRFQGATSGYGYNYQYLGPGPNVDGTYTWVRLTDVTNTSWTMCFADAGRVNYWDNPNQAVLEENHSCDPPSNQFPGVHFRHEGTANVGFLDGHVANLTPVDNVVPSLDPATNPDGWPMAADEMRRHAGLFDLSPNDGDDVFFNTRQ